jgi:hypothetical protein
VEAPGGLDVTLRLEDLHRAECNEPSVGAVIRGGSALGSAQELRARSSAVRAANS